MKRSGEKKGRLCMNYTRKSMPVYVASLLRREGQTETCRLQIFTHSNLCCCHVLESSALVSVCSVSVLSVTAYVYQAWKQQGASSPARVHPADQWPWILSTRLWSCIFLPISCQLLSWLLTFSSEKKKLTQVQQAVLRTGISVHLWLHLVV